MPKSKHRKSHKIKLNQYKDDAKKKQASFKKMMIDNYMKMQQQNIASQEEHTSTEEVVGPEINIDDLNQIEDWEPNIINVDQLVDLDSIVDTKTEELNDNNN